MGERVESVKGGHAVAIAACLWDMDFKAEEQLFQYPAGLQAVIRFAAPAQDGWWKATGRPKYLIRPVAT